MTIRSYDFLVGPQTDTLPNSGVVDSVLVSTKSADYTITDTDNIGTVLVDDTSSNRTITLPTAADNTDRKLLVINTSSDGGTVTVDGEDGSNNAFQTYIWEFTTAGIPYTVIQNVLLQGCTISPGGD